MKKWRKPKGWNKEFNNGTRAAHGVDKITLVEKSKQKVRNYIIRWNEDLEQERQNENEN